MEKTKLLHLLNSLSSWELRNLEQFLRSPFHNKRDDVLRLFEFYRAQRDKRNPDFSDAAAIRSVWHGKPSGAVDYPNLRSYLNKLVEKYLAVEEVLKDEFLLKMRLAAAYERMNMDNSFDKAAGDAKNILEKQSFRNPEYLRRQFELEYVIYDHVSSRPRMKETNLESVSKMLDAHYFAEKLKLSCAQLSFRDVHQKEYDLSILPELMNFLEREREWLSYPAVTVYFYACLALTKEDNEKYFREVSRLLKECRNQFTEREIRDICVLCINFCIKRSNQGDLDYTQNGFDLLREGIEQGYLLTEGILSHHTYINAVAFGIKLKEYEWVERFIETYKIKLVREYRENAYNLSLARLRHAQDNYPEAMRLLASFGTDDPYYYLIAKVLLCNIYFERKEIIPLESLLDTMRTYLQRQKTMDDSKKKHFRDIIKSFKKLVKLAPYDSK